MAFVVIIFLSITLLAGLTVSQDCSVSSIESKVIQCFIVRGIDLPDLFAMYRRTHHFDFLLEDIYAFGDIEVLCGSQKANLKAAMVCAQEEINRCSTNPELVPSNSLSPIVEKMCVNRHTIDFDCVRAEIDEMENCGLKELEKHSPSSLASKSETEIICLASAINVKCLKKSLASCGCATTKVYSDMALDHITPGYCDKDSEYRHRVICSNDDPNEFEYDGLGSVARPPVTPSVTKPPVTRRFPQPLPTSSVAKLRGTTLVIVVAMVTTTIIAL